MNLNLNQRRLVDGVISVFETGSVAGDYSKISIFRDGPGRIRQITYGRWQTTEYGNLKTLVNDYTNAGGIYSSKFVAYVPKIGATALTDNADFKQWLIKAGKEDPVMRITQDRFFDRVYFQPAKRWAERNGFTLPLSMLVIYDSFIHSGKIRDDIRNRFPEKVPVNGGDEKAWILAYVMARNNWLATHSNPEVHPTVYRMRTFRREIDRSNWHLSQLPIIANGTRVPN